jgi:hypothetical protein
MTPPTTQARQAVTDVTLKETKLEIENTIRVRIKDRMPVADLVLPPNPISIIVVGKSADNLQARIVYRDCAPYYINVSQIH